MTVCPHTNLTIPECCCTRCVERQLAEFAPRSGPHALEEGVEPSGAEAAVTLEPQREAAA